MNRKMFLSFVNRIAFLVGVFVMGMAMANDCYAAGRYAGKEALCLAQSGGREGIHAVQYACNRAAVGAGQNGCSLWIGSASDSVIPTIYAVEDSGIVNIAYWGMCTDRIDTTRSITVTNDNDSIDDHMNLTRGLWNRPTSRGTTLDIAKFIAGLTGTKTDDCWTKYTRTVNVGRYHSDGGSYDSQDQEVILMLRSNEDECGEEEGDTCEEWNNSYESSSSSTEDYGDTTVDIRIKNAASRMVGSVYGKWNNGTIYAKPTDPIEWFTCYYPGVQKTANSEVSSINGNNWGNYVPLSTTLCEDYKTVTYKKLHEAYSDWANYYKLSTADDGGATSGDTSGQNGEIGNSSVLSSDSWRYTVGTDVGKTFTEVATTSKPVNVKIGTDNPTKDVRGCHYNEYTGCDPATYTNEDVKEADCAETLRVYTTGDSPIYVGCTTSHTESTCPAENKQYKQVECSCCTHEHIETSPVYTGHLNAYNSLSAESRGPLVNATVKHGPRDDKASVQIPYNFITGTDVSIKENIVYSGSANAMTVTQVTASVYPRYNNVTIDSYATVVPEATVYLYAYVTADSGGGIEGGTVGGSDICGTLGDAAKQCVELKNKSGMTLNGGGNVGGSTDTIWSDLIYNAFDASAGDYMCVASSVSPYSVSSDIDMTGGDGQWIYSSPACAIIAKRPSFQVWGGSLYSVKSIEATYNEKVNIYNAYISNISSEWKKTGGTNIYFTPWVEESLILKSGTTKTVASGAASGLTNKNKAGAGTSTNFCDDRAALSFANYSGTIGTLCNGSGAVGNSGISSGIQDREKLMKYWMGQNLPTNNNVGATIGLNSPGSVGQEVKSASGEKIRYLYRGGDITINGSTVPLKTTYLIHSNGTVTIDGNIKYKDNNLSFADIPKVVIYAKNVNIKCNVGEVDAIIITKSGGNMNTCYNGGDDNDPKRSNQLKVFGMVITDSITLGRTYGAAANAGGMTDPYGTPSDGAAAEIFDYDSSILMWSEYMAGSQETDTQQVVYQHELAPRY